MFLTCIKWSTPWTWFLCGMDVHTMTNELRAVVQAQRLRAEAIKELPRGSLLHRPNAQAWNALEVFEHMTLSSGIYLNGLRKAFASAAPLGSASTTFNPGWLGDWFTKGLMPQADGRIKWKMRTMRMFDPPRQRGASLESIHRFIDQCDGFLHLLEQAPNMDLNKIRVTSSLGPLIRFKAGDALRFPIAHQQRHFLQIERLLREQGHA